MKTKLLLFFFFIALAFTSCVSTSVTNSNGYKIESDKSNAYFEIMPVLCNDENAEILIDSITTGYDFGRNKLRPVEVAVFSEKEGEEIRYFWTTNYQMQQTVKGYDFFGNPEYKTDFFISDDAEKIYINADDILPKTIADQYANSILYIFGGTTGAGNISARNQIKREELAAGEKMRQRPMFYWKENYPYIYKNIMDRLPHWKEFAPNIQQWLAKIARDEKLTGYNELLAVGEKLDSTPKKKIDPTTTYRGEEAVDYIAVSANNLFSQGRISAASLDRILKYVQLNHGQDVYLFMTKENLTAEEFCLGVSQGKIYLQF